MTNAGFIWGMVGLICTVVVGIGFGFTIFPPDNVSIFRGWHVGMLILWMTALYSQIMSVMR